MRGNISSKIHLDLDVKGAYKLVILVHYRLLLWPFGLMLVSKATG